MKQIIFALISMCSSFQIWSQKIVYKPVFVNQCTGKVDTDWLVEITNEFDFKRSKYADFEDISFDLPHVGTYWMHYFSFEKDSVKIDLHLSGIICDTFYAPKLELIHFVSNPPRSEYLDCGQVANGIVKDFYQDGKIRKTGNFREGQLIDTLKEFYLSGNLRSITIAGKKLQWLTYYENGNLKEDYNVSRRYQNQYYPTGKLKCQRTWNKKFNSKVTEYDENGEIIKRSIPLDG